METRLQRAVLLALRSVTAFAVGTVSAAVAELCSDQLQQELPSRDEWIPPWVAVTGLIVALLGGIIAISLLIRATAPPAIRSAAASLTWGLVLVAGTVPLPLLWHVRVYDGSGSLPLSLGWWLLTGLAMGFCSLLVTTKDPAKIAWVVMTMILLNLGAPTFVTVVILVVLHAGWRR